MKKSSLILAVLLAILLFNYGCDPREETKKPVACFDYVPMSDIAPGDEIIFTNCSTDAESYKWEFGDESTGSVAKDPKHKYDAPGEYIVTLIVTNKNLQDQKDTTITIVNNVTACFTFSPNVIHVGEQVNFTNCSEGADSYKWDFDGNGTIDNQNENPNFVYNMAGKFTVKLIASVGNSTDEVTHELTILENPIKACFTMSPNPALTYENVYFTNCSEGADSYEWDIDGNGSIDSYDKDPVFFFLNEGIYNVKLIAKKGNASAEIVHQITITDEPVVIDPTDYDGMPYYTTIYANEFSDPNNEDFSIGSDTDWEAYISEDAYHISNSSTEFNRFFWTNTAGMPAGDFEIEMEFQVTYDNDNYGGGLFWSLLYDESGGSIVDYYIYRFSGGYINFGDSQNGLWLTDWEYYGNDDGWNTLTARKYENTYYIFLNTVLVGQHTSSGDFGDKFGFFVGQQSKISIEWIGLWSLEPTKSKSSKTITNYGLGKGKGFTQKVKASKTLNRK